MKFSKRWLMQHLDAEIGTAELVERLTMAGLEVDGVEPASAGFSGVVVGAIEAVEPHPDADQLRICRVRGSGAVQQVVCGAPNAAQGLKAPFAEPGARLPDGVNDVQTRAVAKFHSCGNDGHNHRARGVTLPEASRHFDDRIQKRHAACSSQSGIELLLGCLAPSRLRSSGVIERFTKYSQVVRFLAFARRFK